MWPVKPLSNYCCGMQPLISARELKNQKSLPGVDQRFEMLGD